MRNASLRPLTVLLQICTVWCTKLRKHFNAIVEVFYCFTVAIGSLGNASCIKLEGKQKLGSCSAHAKQGGCRVRQQLRARSESLAISAALKQLSENINKAMCVVIL